MSSAPPNLQPLLIIVGGVVGLFAGSFLNVVVYRTPRGLSVVEPRSFCPRCGRTLTWWENVPVVSWTALGGHCRTCGTAISFRYPALEISTASAFALVTWSWKGSVTSVAFCALAAGAIAVSAIELDGLRAPLAIQGVAIGIALPVVVVANGAQGHDGLIVGALVGTAAGWGTVLVLRRIDPTCGRRGHHGRSLLLGAGCWLGTVAGARAWTLGAAVGAGVLSFVLAVVLGRGPGRDPAAPSGLVGTAARAGRSLAEVPLVVATLVALVVSLVAKG